MYYVNHKQRRTTWTDPREMQIEKEEESEQEDEQESEVRTRKVSDPSAPPLQTPVKDSDATTKDVIILENKRFAYVLAVEHLVPTERKKFRLLVQGEKRTVTRHLDDDKTSILTEDDTVSGAVMSLLETSQSHFPQLQHELVGKITDAESVLVAKDGILLIGIALQNALTNKDMKLASSSLQVLHRTLKDGQKSHEKTILENFSKREASLVGVILTCLSQEGLPSSVTEPAFGVLYVVFVETITLILYTLNQHNTGTNSARSSHPHHFEVFCFEVVSYLYFSPEKTRTMCSQDFSQI